jgi:hypothetical protein
VNYLRNVCFLSRFAIDFPCIIVDNDARCVFHLVGGENSVTAESVRLSELSLTCDDPAFEIIDTPNSSMNDERFIYDVDYDPSRTSGMQSEQTSHHPYAPQRSNASPTAFKNLKNVFFNGI